MSQELRSAAGVEWQAISPCLGHDNMKDSLQGLLSFCDKVVLLFATKKLLQRRFPSPFKNNIFLPFFDFLGRAQSPEQFRVWTEATPGWEAKQCRCLQCPLGAGEGLGEQGLLPRSPPLHGTLQATQVLLAASESSLIHLIPGTLVKV